MRILTGQSKDGHLGEASIGPNKYGTFHQVNCKYNTRIEFIIESSMKRQKNQRSNCQHMLDHRKSKIILEKHLLLH